ncbi:hypothetical protein D3C79_1036670 [compost metagenome]
MWSVALGLSYSSISTVTPKMASFRSIRLSIAAKGTRGGFKFSGSTPKVMSSVAASDSRLLLPALSSR